MEVIITIQCDTVAEVKAHLWKLQRQLTKYSKKLKIDKLHDDLPMGEPEDLSDDNCYGSHEVLIN